MNDVLCWKDEDSALDTLRRRLWERLVRMSQDVVRFHQADWWHDRDWLVRYLTEDVTQEPIVFTYGWRESGTSIGTDEALVAKHNEHAVQVTVYLDADKRAFRMNTHTLTQEG
jgi:hypothetical protein